MTGIYRGKVSHQYPIAHDGDHWQPLENQPYPVVILLAAGPDFDHTGMPVLVVANPDRGDRAVRDLEALVEAVRQWGPHTPRRVTRALADLGLAPDPTENPDD